MHGNVPVRFGRGRLDSLGNKGLAAYLIGCGNHLGCSGGKARGRDNHKTIDGRRLSLLICRFLAFHCSHRSNELLDVILRQPGSGRIL